MATITLTSAMDTKIGQAWKAANFDDSSLQAGTDSEATILFFKARSIQLLNPAVKNAAKNDAGVVSATTTFDAAKAAYEQAITDRDAVVTAATADSDVNGAIS